MAQILAILTDKDRWRNPALYLSLLASVPAILAMFHVQVAPEQWSAIENVVKAIITLLIELGILMNPKTQGYGDGIQ